MKFLKKLVFCLILIEINFIESDPNSRFKRLYESENDEFETITLAPEQDLQSTEEIESNLKKSLLSVEEVIIPAKVKVRIDLSIVEVDCSSSFKKDSHSLHREAMCKQPRKMLVPVKMPSKYYMPGTYHMPAMFEVDRCDGICLQTNYRCLPGDTEIVEVPVHTYRIQASRLMLTGSRLSAQTQRPIEKCMMIKIEKHTRCRCGCYMTQKNCNEQQVFSPATCACVCKDTSKGSTCAPANRMWDNEKCDCVCPPTSNRECSSGAVFDEKTCRCMQTNGY